MKKKIVVFSGAGLDRESGILTFRDTQDGMWNNYKIDDVATPDGWKKDPQKVLNFYNERRAELPNVKPNKAHTCLVELEQHFDVVHITQNVSDLLERAVASKVYHLHGELTKAKGDNGTKKTDRFKPTKIIDIGYNDINLGDVCEVTGKQLRPNVVWFGEYPAHVNKSYDAMANADILIIIGTSLQIGYTINLLQSVNHKCRVIYIDPNPTTYLSDEGLVVEYIKKKAVSGVSKLTKTLISDATKEELNK